MVLHIIIYLITIVISISLLGFIAAYTWRHRETQGATALAFICILGAWGALAEFISMISGSQETAALWYNARFITLAGIPMGTLIFSLQYTGRSSLVIPRNIILLLAIPVITQVMIWTNGLHGFWLKNDVGFYRIGPFLIADTSLRVPGPWFMVHMFYGYISLGIGLALLLNRAFRLMRLYRVQALALAAGCAVLAIGAAIPTFNLMPRLRINPITQSLALSALIFAWAVFRHRFIDMIPIARDMLIDSMEDSMLVLDIHNRIVDVNRAMISLLALALPAKSGAMPKKLIGLPVTEVLGPWRRAAAQFKEEMDTAAEIAVEIAAEERFFNLRLTPLTGGDGNTLGTLMNLNDITWLKREERKQKLAINIMEILNRDTNLHNTINSILSALKSWTNFDAVGIRIQEGEDYPYYIQNGFGEDFVKAENSLASRLPDGGLCRDEAGNIRYECTCGMIVSGNTDRSNPIFTEGGSAWMNDSMSMLNIPANEDPRLNPRNRCIHEGYQSIAVVPIRLKNKIVGLLHLGDRRKNMLTIELIRFLEGLTASIGIAIVRKRTEEAMRESEVRYRLLAETSSDVIWTMDLNGRFTYVSPSVKKLTGWLPEEVMAMGMEDYMPPEQVTRLKEELAAELSKPVAERATDRTMVIKQYTKGGTSINEEISISWVLDDRGEPVGLRGSNRDISDRMKAEEELRESEERLRIIGDSIPDGMVFQVDYGVDGASRTMTYVSAGVQRMYGISQAEALDDAMALHGQIHEDDRTRLAESEAKAMAAMTNFTEEFRIVRPSGEVKWHRVVSSPRRQSNNRIVWDGIELDITDRKLAEIIIQTRLRLVEFSASHTLPELHQKALDEVCAITYSPIGFYHFVEPDQVTLSLQAWSTRTLREFCTAEGVGFHYDIDKAGVWVDCVRQRRPVIHNDYASLAHRKGMPEGHPRVERELVVPIIRNEKIVAILGVGNKPLDYLDKDMEIVSYFADVVWEISRRKGAEEALQKSEHELRERNIRMENDLKIAQTAQKKIIMGALPQNDLVAIDYRYLPLEKVGGDYFSFSMGDDRSVGFFIGDVSGHGIASALFTSLLKLSTDRMFRKYGTEPSAFMRYLNNELIEYMSSYFVTGIYGIFGSYESTEGVSVRFSNAGHPLPVLVRANGSGPAFIGAGGPIIGIKENIDYWEIEERLLPGDRLFIYTDGIPEVINEKNIMIGFDSELLAIFGRTRRASLKETLDAILKEIRSYQGTQPLQDDITIIGFEVIKR